MKANIVLLRVLSVISMLFAVTFMSGLFWPKEWGMGFEFLLNYYQVRTSNMFMLIAFCCCGIWMGFGALSEYLWKQSNG